MVTQFRVVVSKGNRKFTQEQVFRLRESGLYDAEERVVKVVETDLFLQDKSNKIGEEEDYARRTGDIVFYRNGFEKNLELQLGSKIVYVYNKIPHILVVPDVPVFDAMQNKTVSLRKATGMGVLNIEDLELTIDVNGNNVVSVRSDANPTAYVVDVMRPNEWATTNENGFPLRLQPSTDKNPDARYMNTKSASSFEEGSDGYFVSAVRYDLNFNGRRFVSAGEDWSVSCGVAVTGLKEAAPQKSALLVADGLSPTEVRAALSLNNDALAPEFRKLL